MIGVDCLERCGNSAMPGKARCSRCEKQRQDVRNASVKRRAYRAPEYLAQPKGGTCSRCGQGGSDTRDHVVPIATQMRQWGEVRDHRTLPAHRSCNSARGARC